MFVIKLAKKQIQMANQIQQKSEIIILSISILLPNSPPH